MAPFRGFRGPGRRGVRLFLPRCRFFFRRPRHGRAREAGRFARAAPPHTPTAEVAMEWSYATHAFEETVKKTDGTAESPDPGSTEYGASPSEASPPEDEEEPVLVAVVPEKGRCLFAARSFKPGEAIVTEAPIFVALATENPDLFERITAISDEEALELPPIWHFAALHTLLFMEPEKRRQIATKWIPEEFPTISRDVSRIVAALPPQFHVDTMEYERFLNAWRYNSFGHHTENDGLVIYDRISMMAHSCNPTASWHYDEGDTFVLRARVHLERGDEICISYIGEDDLLRATHIRREKLQSWLFTCQCERCGAVRDDARGFRCPECGAGCSFFKTDEEGVVAPLPCTGCGTLLSESRVREFVQFEDAYVARLEETSSSSMSDAEAVFREAQRVFAQHWVLNALNTTLWEGYRTAQEVEAATLAQRARMHFLEQVIPRASYAHSAAAEDLADFLSGTYGGAMTAFRRNTLSRLYEDAMNQLIILCGDTHEHTYTVHQKLEAVQESDAQQRQHIQ
eukprot:Polyplicarium_translucidae@DN3101_c0_g1_i1.p1